MAGGGKRPLRKFAGAFDALAMAVGPNSPPMTVQDFTDACLKLQACFKLMGVDRAFWASEFMAKVKEMKNVSKSVATLEELIDQDMANNRVVAPGSSTRNLILLKRALTLIKLLFEGLLAGRSFRSSAKTAYKAEFACYHPTIIQNRVKEAIDGVPTVEELLQMVNEKEDDAKIEMKKYVDASTVVTDYIDGLFTSRNLGTQ